MHLAVVEIEHFRGIKKISVALSTVTAVMGIVITVVAIVVQLAATRYTPRVTELFFRERTNLFVLGFFVVTCITAIWVSMSVGHGFTPRASVIVSICAVTISLFCGLRKPSATARSNRSRSES